VKYAHKPFLRTDLITTVQINLNRQDAGNTVRYSPVVDSVVTIGTGGIVGRVLQVWLKNFVDGAHGIYSPHSGAPLLQRRSPCVSHFPLELRVSHSPERAQAGAYRVCDLP